MLRLFINIYFICICLSYPNCFIVLFTEILKLLEVGNGENRIPEDTFTETQSYSLHSTPKDTVHLAGKSTSILQSAPDLHSSTAHKSVTKGNNSPEMALTLNKNISFEPKVVDIEHIEKQIQESLRFVNLL